MKIIIGLLTCFMSFSAKSQATTFPEDWLGTWKGELEWYKTGKEVPQKVNMELRIQPADSAGHFTWQIIYGSATEDNRPYTLISKDSAKVHWIIDEHNGILLDQYWIANKFSGAFTVMGNTIINNYWIENDKLLVEFYSINARPITTTGKGTEESPHVDSYRIGSYQKAVLLRTK